MKTSTPVAVIGPPGYGNAAHAFDDLISFGPGCWGLRKWLVILFHAERTISYGREAGQYSTAQAIEGVFSHGRYVRGTVGVSPATYKRINAKLIAEGLLFRTRRSDERGADIASEYRLNWKAIKAAIEAYRQSLTLRRSQEIR